MKLLSINNSTVSIAIYQHLLNAFDTNGIEYNDISDKITALKEYELSCFGWVLEQGETRHNMHLYYLQGLGLSVACEYLDILAFVADANGIEVGDIPDQTANRILDSWFDVLAVKLEQLYKLKPSSKSMLTLVEMNSETL